MYVIWSKVQTDDKNPIAREHGKWRFSREVHHT